MRVVLSLTSTNHGLTRAPALRAELVSPMRPREVMPMELQGGDLLDIFFIAVPCKTYRYIVIENTWLALYAYEVVTESNPGRTVP